MHETPQHYWGLEEGEGTLIFEVFRDQDL